jgi:hypothetical protein
MKLLVALFSRPRIARAACLAAAVSLAAGCAGGGSSPIGSTALPSAPGNAPIGAPAALPQGPDLASDTTACSKLTVAGVSAAASQLAAAGSIRATATAAMASVKAPNVLADPEGFRKFALASMPAAPHPAEAPAQPMTSVQYATFRAAQAMAHTGVSAQAAIALCASQAAAASAGAPRTDINNCGGMPCNIPEYFTAVTDSNGNRTVAEYLNGTLRSQTTTDSNGDTVASGSGGLTTMSSGAWVVVNGKWVNVPGPIPAWTQNVTVPGVSNTISVSAPGPAYVPQSGWMSAPGSGLSMYIDPSGTWGVLETGDSAGADYWVVSQTGGPTAPLTVCGYATVNGTKYSKCLPPLTFSGSGSGPSLRRAVPQVNNYATLGVVLIGLGLGALAVGSTAPAWLAGWLIGSGIGSIYLCVATNCLGAQVSDTSYDPWPGYGEADTIEYAGYGDDGGGGCIAGPRNAVGRDCITDDGDDEW